MVSGLGERTRDPLAIGCTSCARLILSAGRKTIEGMPAAAQYAANAAEVSPVEAQPTAWTALGFCFRSLLTCSSHTETAQGWAAAEAALE